MTELSSCYKLFGIHFCLLLNYNMGPEEHGGSSQATWNEICGPYILRIIDLFVIVFNSILGADKWFCIAC